MTDEAGTLVLVGPEERIEPLDGSSDEVIHWVCMECWPDASGKTIAYCGLDTTHEKWYMDEDYLEADICVMCHQVEQSGAVCPGCGIPY